MHFVCLFVFPPKNILNRTDTNDTDYKRSFMEFMIFIFLTKCMHDLLVKFINKVNIKRSLKKKKSKWDYILLHASFRKEHLKDLSSWSIKWFTWMVMDSKRQWLSWCNSVVCQGLNATLQTLWWDRVALLWEVFFVHSLVGCMSVANPLCVCRTMYLC